ncbi:hypothetical protein A4G99_18950 [Haladaptatus sp. R4]|nr:hypothetical protein A4G99_18950 [Haladaptatus sp. R4]
MKGVLFRSEAARIFTVPAIIVYMIHSKERKSSVVLHPGHFHNFPLVSVRKVISWSQPGRSMHPSDPNKIVIFP